MRVISPRTLDEALAWLAVEGAGLTPVAGATDLLVGWPEQDTDDLALLDLSPLRGELRPYRLTETALELGALTTYWDISTSDEVARALPLLAEAARQVGAVQIQMRGTWAGNVENGSPAADGVLALMAYDASVVLQSRTGRREVPLDAYYTGYRQTVRRPHELIVALRVPRRPRQREWLYKVGTRRAQAISKVAVAVVQDVRGWRVVANSVAPTVCRCRTLEAALAAGRTFGSPDEIRHTLENDIAPIDDVRSTAAYRANVLARLLYHWLAGHGP